MNILGLDQSLTETGYVVLNADGLATRGTIKPKTKGVMRLKEIQQQVIKLIDDHAIDAVVMEDYAYGTRNTRCTFSLGELGGVLKLAIFLRDIKLVVVPPTLLKKFVCGKGNVQKDQMLLQAFKKFNFEFDNNNICDAFCLAKFYEAYLNYKAGAKTTQNERDCFQKLFSQKG